MHEEESINNDQLGFKPMFSIFAAISVCQAEAVLYGGATVQRRVLHCRVRSAAPAQQVATSVHKFAMQQRHLCVVSFESYSVDGVNQATMGGGPKLLNYHLLVGQRRVQQATD